MTFILVSKFLRVGQVSSWQPVFVSVGLPSSGQIAVPPSCGGLQTRVRVLVPLGSPHEVEQTDHSLQVSQFPSSQSKIESLFSKHFNFEAVLITKVRLRYH